MAEKTIPWWRKALNYALDGIRTGFGLFPRHAAPEPGIKPNEEPELVAYTEANLEEETVLTHSFQESETIAKEPEVLVEAAAEREMAPAAIDVIEAVVAERNTEEIKLAPEVAAEQSAEPLVASVQGEVPATERDEDTAEKILREDPEKRSSGAKAQPDSEPLMYGLKPVPFSELTPSASSKAPADMVPFMSGEVPAPSKSLAPDLEASGQLASTDMDSSVQAEAPVKEPEGPAVPGPDIEPNIKPETPPAIDPEPEPATPPVTEPNPDPENAPAPVKDAEPVSGQELPAAPFAEELAPIDALPAFDSIPEGAGTEEIEPRIANMAIEPGSVAEPAEDHAEAAPLPSPQPAVEALAEAPEQGVDFAGEPEPDAAFEPISSEQAGEPVAERELAASPEPETEITPPPIEQAADSEPEPAPVPDVETLSNIEPTAEPTAEAEPAPAPEPENEPVVALSEQPIEPVATEPAVSHEPTPVFEPAEAITPVAEPATVAAAAPASESWPPFVLTPKPPIKVESRDDNADLSPFSVIVDQVYDGPLDLLLDLIRKQDIDIYDIPIAKITAQFLAYVNQLKAGDVDVAGEFIYIASLLIHIKSKMLLPRAPAGPEEAEEDPRRELVERLLEHERFKNAAQMLQQKQMLEAATWTNPGIREFKDDDAAEPEIAADTVDLVRIFRDILERARKRPVFNVDEDAVTVGQMIQFLARRLTMEDKPIALRRLLSHTRSERALIAMFLALLELVRLQAILLRQDLAFSEIFIKKHTGFDEVMDEGLSNARDDWR